MLAISKVWHEVAYANIHDKQYSSLQLNGCYRRANTGSVKSNSKFKKYSWITSAKRKNKINMGFKRFCSTASR